MRLTFPHMGFLSIPIQSLLEGLGHQVIVPPAINQRTFELGVKNSPEFACLPFKINMGNFIEALEEGAEAILMAGGVGPCRFGYFAQVQKEILSDLGYSFRLLLLDPPGVGIKPLYQAIRDLTKNSSLANTVFHLRLAWAKTDRLEQANKLLRYYLPRVEEPKKLLRMYEDLVATIQQKRSFRDLDEVFASYSQALITLPWKRLQVIRVKIIGEIYMVLETRANFHLERLLGEMGVETQRTISLSHWVEEHLLGAFFPGYKRRTIHLAKPYLSSFVGGHGRETIAETVDAGVNRLDGVIQVLPFTCMPEIVAKSLLPDLSRRYDLPILSLVLDEHSAEAGLLTRLEAFVDLLYRKKSSKTEKVRHESTCLSGN